MSARRSYGSYNDGCAAAHALDLIGERWALIVVRELLLGPKRFSDLQRDVLGIGPALLSQRLQDLAAHGIVRRTPLPGAASLDGYELTEWGSGLESVNTALSLWAVASPALPLEADMSPDTMVLAMRAHARPAAAGTGERRVVLHLTDSRRRDASPVTYLARASAQGTSIGRLLDPGPADAEVWAGTRDWKACVIGGATPESVPAVRMRGNAAAVGELIALTSLGSTSEPSRGDPG